MAKTQESPQKKPRVKALSRHEEEMIRVKAWREERFKKILEDNGLSGEQVQVFVPELVDSESSAHDLEKLIEKGCDPETAVKIVA